MYRKEKAEISREHIFDNSRGSGLLFEARSGVLYTRGFRAHFEDDDGAEKSDDSQRGRGGSRE